MPKIRLYTNSPLSANAHIELSKEQAHYLVNVMRKKAGYQISLFNGTDGQWLGEIESISKKAATIKILQQTKLQKSEPDVWLCFALIKNAPINNLVQKATELGASKLIPIITEHTIATRTNVERLQANAVEAAEQSERLTVPQVTEPVKLIKLLEEWDESRKLILCDESGGGVTFAKAVANIKSKSNAIIIGPEGGFSQTEFEIMRKKPYIVPVGMGPRILRADTAAIAALSCYQNILGDWDEQPCFGD